MNPAELLILLIVCLVVAMIFCTMPILRVSSDLGISVPRFIQDFVKEIFKDRNWFGKICSGFMVICAAPSFIASTVIWGGKSHGGKYYV